MTPCPGTRPKTTHQPAAAGQPPATGTAPALATTPQLDEATGSVWPVAQTPSRSQRNGRYLPAAMAHPGKMLPALARTAIATYTAPGRPRPGPDVRDRHHAGRSHPRRP